jgi:hypothetical protein
MKDSITVVGLDVHKNSIEIVTADADGAMEVRRFGRIGGTMDALDRAVRKLVSKGSTLRFVYEARPCGYEIYRHLTAKGFSCKVVAPSKTPKKSGDRIKNDRRDAETLARLERAGELTGIYVPREEDEAMRDLTRAREDAVRLEDGPAATEGLPPPLRETVSGKIPGPRPYALVVGRRLPHVRSRSCCRNICGSGSMERMRDDGSDLQLLPEWRVSVVQALRPCGGSLVAVTTIAEIGDLSRFKT